MKPIWKSLGLMSGTSLDGVDACLIETDGDARVTLLGHFYQPFPPPLKARLGVVVRDDIPLVDILRLEKDLTNFYADVVAASGLWTEADVVGCHGQTIRHVPEERLTWQLGDVNRLGERLHALAGRALPVVMDFRRRDMAAGGEGAPLVPLFHAELLRGRGEPAALLNIGGVANVTLLQAGGAVAGSDCGPGMGLLDAFVMARAGIPFDKDGDLADAGTPDAKLVNRFMEAHPFWQRPLPRSVDRYAFDAFLQEMVPLSLEDGAATLAALTVAGIDRTLRELGAVPATLRELVPVGGGAHNRAVVNGLADKGWAVQDASVLGWQANAVEAACFAWMAVRRMQGKVTSLSSTTGARHPTVGGVVGF